MMVNDINIVPADAVNVTTHKDGAIEYYLATDQVMIDRVALGEERERLLKLLGERNSKKKIRSETVDKITVKTSEGNVFDGDEISQNRMARAIVAMEGLPVNETTLWVLSDNTAAQVTRDELKEALLLAGQAQSNLWVIK